MWGHSPWHTDPPARGEPGTTRCSARLWGAPLPRHVNLFFFMLKKKRDNDKNTNVPKSISYYCSSSSMTSLQIVQNWLKRDWGGWRTPTGRSRCHRVPRWLVPRGAGDVPIDGRRDKHPGNFSGVLVRDLPRDVEKTPWGFKRVPPPAPRVPTQSHGVALTLVGTHMPPAGTRCGTGMMVTG